jgi:hypothetical protein
MCVTTPELTAFTKRTLYNTALTDKTNNCCGDLPEYFSIECLATRFSDPNDHTFFALQHPTHRHRGTP